LILNRDAGETGCLLDTIKDEVVWMDGLHSESRQRRGREIPQVEGHDERRVRVDRGGEHMPVVRVGQRQ
jgi:hypothetical protein